MTTRQTLILRLGGEGTQRELAWEEFYDLYGPMISRLARHFGASRDEAADVVHDVMTSFFAFQPKFVYEPQKGRFRAFLRVCTRNATYERFRRRQRAEGAGGMEMDHLADGDAEEADEIWEKIWDDELLRQAVELTRIRYSTNDERKTTFAAFEQYVLKGRDAAEVAVELGLKVASVHQARTRVSKALKEELESLQVRAD